MDGIDVENVSVTYLSASGKTVNALKDLSLDIRSGEFVTVIGPSGCGKSTLLHCMGGLLAPSGGVVRLAGKPMRAPRPSEAAFVFQDYSLFPWMKIVDNVALGLQFSRVRKQERIRRAMERLELVGLAANAQSYPAELSGGMQQRVAVARALTMEPDFLLLDEPFGALDEQTRRSLGVEMAGILRSTGRTVVLVTHSLDEAIYWADRVVVMAKEPGRIVEEIHIENDWPRGIGFMRGPEFAEVRARLFDLTAAEGSVPLAEEEAVGGEV